MGQESRPDRRQRNGVIVLSLGGSLLVPDEHGPRVEFIAKFAQLIIAEQERWRKIIIVCGGGRTARTYIEGARGVLREMGVLPAADRPQWVADQHWLGIHATRANAHLMRTIFRHAGNHAFFRVLKNPHQVTLEALQSERRVIIAAGWKPGWSTDYIAARMAGVFGARTIVNLTNVDRVYDRDPKLDGAQPLQEVTWEEYFSKFPRTKFEPGDNTPFDPVAAGFAEEHGMRVIVFKGSNLKDLKGFLGGGPYVDRFRGTVIGGTARTANGSVEVRA